MANDSIEEILTGIGDLRFEALQKLVNQYYKEKIDITKELTKRLESLQQEALGRGSATSRFQQISKEMAFLWQLKAEIAAKDTALEKIKESSYPGLAVKESTLLNRVYRIAEQALMMKGGRKVALEIRYLKNRCGFKAYCSLCKKLLQYSHGCNRGGLAYAEAAAKEKIEEHKTKCKRLKPTKGGG